MLVWPRLPGQKAQAPARPPDGAAAKGHEGEAERPSTIASAAGAAGGSNAIPDCIRETGTFEDARADGAVEEDDEGDAYFDNEDDEVFETMDDNPAKIQPGLFIGSFLAEQNKEKLRKAGVTHVLQVAEGLSPSHPDDFTYMSVQVMDCPSEDLVAHFDRAFKFIDSAVERQQACLVHCVAGVSRSSTVCIGWLMWKHRIQYDEAFRRVHKVRPWIMPNIGFRHQLRIFEEQDCDLVKWRAWRHRDLHGHNFKEEEAATVVSLASLGIRPPPGAAAAAAGGPRAGGGDSKGDAGVGGNGAEASAGGGASGVAAPLGGGGADAILSTFPRNEHYSRHVSSSTYVPELGTSF